MIHYLDSHRLTLTCYCRVALLALLLPLAIYGQQPDRIERKVQDPIGDAEAERKALRRNLPGIQLNITARTPAKPDEFLSVSAAKEEIIGKGDVIIYSGDVHLSYADITLLGDRATLNKPTNDVIVEGNVFFEQQGQSVAAERIEFNLETKRGTLFKSTAFTDRTPDGTTIVVDATRTDKTGEESYTLENANLTACQEPVPKWSFTAKRARIKLDDRAVMYNPIFRIKNIPVLYLPYISLSISKKERSSGFLLPTSGSSNIKGRTLHVAYYQTLGRSADILIRTDVFTKRGIGMGFDFRARPDENSRIAFGAFLVKDRLLGPKTDAFGNKLPDQGGSSFYADAVQYFKNGFVAVADVNITSNFAFRQVFAENLQQAISPEERSQLYVNKNSGAFSFNASLYEQSIFLRDDTIKTRTLPSFELNKRSERLSDSFPIYISFESAIEGMKRTVARGNNSTFRSPNISQRFDFFPNITLPLKPVGGFTFTPSLGFRSTFYSDSLNPVTREVTGQNLYRNYADLNLDVRAPSFARIYRNKDGSPKFKHVIEPYAAYRRIIGADDLDQIIHFDERDLIAETNEIEYGITNRFFIKRATPDGKSTQAYEWMSLTVAQKHFFDPGFGGTVKDGQRNQFVSATTLSGFAFLGYQRDFSPLNVNARVRPSNTTFADVRMDMDTQQNQLRNVAVSAGTIRRLFSLSQSWYYTRRVLGPGVKFDATTLPGNQMDTSVFAGNSQNGPYLGVTIAYDFRNRFFDGTARDPRYINLVTTGGWAWDCCSFQFQNYTFKAGLRNENRFLFSFTLKGIGTIGTDNTGQQRRRR
ncbi:MAG: LPS-assembly protein LptD [Acidobacteria bacterium]|nr:LPS-assembly protein LptD [Acidobacteriota bacterium]